MRALKYVAFALAAGCTAMVGTDPRVDPADATDDTHEVDGDHSIAEASVPVHDASVPDANKCDASACHPAYDTCKKNCAAAANACNAACNGDDSKTCKKLCNQTLDACNAACTTVCNACVSGCGPSCGP